jgi:hypothetical protein
MQWHIIFTFLLLFLSLLVIIAVRHWPGFPTPTALWPGSPETYAVRVLSAQCSVLRTTDDSGSAQVVSGGNCPLSAVYVYIYIYIYRPATPRVVSYQTTGGSHVYIAIIHRNTKHALTAETSKVQISNIYTYFQCFMFPQTQTSDTDLRPQTSHLRLKKKKIMIHVNARICIV